MVFLLTDPQTYAIIVTKINPEFRKNGEYYGFDSSDT